KEWIYGKLLQGYRPAIEENYQTWSRRTGELTKPKTLYKLENTERSFFEVNKTLHDYAAHIVNNNLTDENKANDYITAEEQRIQEEQAEQARIKAEEDARREQEKQQYEAEKQAKKIERWTKIQNIILSLTEDELTTIDNI